jgi:hypothetical protein
MGLILLIVLIVLLMGGLLTWGYSRYLRMRSQRRRVSAAGSRASASAHGTHSQWLLTRNVRDKERAKDLVFGGRGKESRPRRAQGTGSTGTGSTLLSLLTAPRRQFVLVKRRRQRRFLERLLR